MTVSFRYSGYALHIIIWGALLLLPYLVSSSANDYKIGVIPGLFFTETVLINAGIFYANAYYLYPKLYNRRFWFLYLIASILLLFASVWLKFHIIAAWFPYMMKEAAAYRYIVAPSVITFIISLIYRRIIDRFRFEQAQKEKQAAQVLTELKFLRSQISPHFMFNVLTNMVSLARKKSDRLEQSLISLSDLMRYMLYDASEKKVELKKEVEYLYSYIELQKLRFENEVNINCTIDLNDEDGRYTIEPMLLIPFVENAFKHGIGHRTHPYIFIKLLVNQESLIFEVLNNFDPDDTTSKDESSGIGLNNVRTRLNMLYKNDYSLVINNNNNLFHVILTLKLI
ncbi:MAG: histidine kinase [Bacteroidetes bacterium]|nr:histidine kinase [Bacteroidota bacterium]